MALNNFAQPYNVYGYPGVLNQNPQLTAYPFQQQTQQAPATNGIIWVQGVEEAKSYNVAPNTTVPLWDSENQVIYMKSADSMGKPSMKYIDYTVREEVKPESNYVSKSEFSKLSSQLADITNQLKQLKDNRKGRNDG